MPLRISLTRMPVARLAISPKLPSSSLWISSTTLRWKNGSRTCGIAMSNTGGSRSRASSDIALILTRGFGVEPCVGPAPSRWNCSPGSAHPTRKRPRQLARPWSILVAGAGFEPATFGL